MAFLKRLTPFTLPFLIAACGNDDLDPNDISAPDIYEFTSQTDPASPSSVDYKEAVTRILLIKELEHLIGSNHLQTVGESNGRAFVLHLLNRIYKVGTKDLTNNLGSTNLYDDPANPTPTPTPTPISGINPETDITSDLALEQQDFSQLAQNVNLMDKMPGIAYPLTYRDEEDATKGRFIGWPLTGVTGDDMPDALIQHWFEKIADIATDGNLDTKFINSGRDYQQLVSTFLLGAIGFGQISSTHLNTTSGLTAENSGDSSLAYTPLEHQWDLAFGYYGGVRHLATLSDTQITQQKDHNYVGQSIDLFSEYNFDYAQQTVSRDMVAPLADSVMSDSIIQAFLNGRQLISSAYKSTESRQSLQSKINAEANIILENWEKSLAATSIHFSNTTADYVLRYPGFANEYAASWSKLKAYSLALQFHPNPTLSADVLQELHVMLRETPEVNLDVSKLINYSLELSIEARGIFEVAFEFSTENARVW